MKTPRKTQGIWSYCLVWGVYTALWTFDLFTVGGLYHTALQQNPSAQFPANIIDLFERNNPELPLGLFIASLFAVLLVVSQLSTVLPIMCFFSRRQLLELCYGRKQIPDKAFYGYAVFFTLYCVGIQVLALDLSIVISCKGALAGVLLM